MVLSRDSCMGKGQVTLYVILGLFLVFLIGIYIYVRTETTQNNLDTSLKQALTEDAPKKLIVRHASSAIKSGLSKTKKLLDPAAQLFLTPRGPPSIPSYEPDKTEPEETTKPPCDTPVGDMLPTPPPEISFDDFPHTYAADHYVYYFNMGGVENIPTLEQFSQMFANKLRKDLPALIEQIPKDIADFEILPDKVRVQVLITNDAIQTKMSIPLCIDGQPTPPAQVGPVKVKTNFAQMLDFSRWIVQQDIEHPDYIDVSALEDEAERRNMKVNIIEEDEARVYTLIDMDPDVDQQFLSLSFASIL